MTTEEILEKTIGKLEKKGYDQAYLAQVESILKGETDTIGDLLDNLIKETYGID